jgi:hypothetical protein
VPKVLLKTTRARFPPTLVWTIWRSVWLLKCMNGAGAAGAAAVWPDGAGATGAGVVGGGGICGRPTSDVAQVPTQCSPVLALWAKVSGLIVSRPIISAPTARRTSCRLEDLMGCASLEAQNSITGMIPTSSSIH